MLVNKQYYNEAKVGYKAFIFLVSLVHSISLITVDDEYIKCQSAPSLLNIIHSQVSFFSSGSVQSIYSCNAMQCSAVQ